MAGRILAHIDFLDSTIASLSELIDARTAAHQPAYDLLLPVPGLERLTIDVAVAETGADMSPCPALGIWCRGRGSVRAPRVGRQRRRVGTPPGNGWLRRALVEAVHAAARSKDTSFAAQYRQIARRRGPNKAAVAVAHSLLDVIWYLSATGVCYEDLGADSFQRRRDPERQAVRLIRQLERLGHKVILQPVGTA